MELKKWWRSWSRHAEVVTVIHSTLKHSNCCDRLLPFSSFNLQTSIHFPLLIHLRGRRRGWNLSKLTSGGRRGAPSEVPTHQRAPEKTDNHVHSYWKGEDFASVTNTPIQCMSLDCGRKYLERAHTNTGRTFKLNTGRTLSTRGFKMYYYCPMRKHNQHTHTKKKTRRENQLVINIWSSIDL